MSTLFEALLGTARRVAPFYTGRATATGTTTTIIDTVERTENDDAWNEQTIFILGGTYASNSRRISDYASSSRTLTISPALAGAVAEGVRYLLSPASKEELIQAVNAALEHIGPVTQVDDSSLVVVDNQTEYTLPSGVANVMRVEVASGSSADYDYERVFNWYEINGKLYFDNELGYTAGHKIRLFYNDEHDSVSSDSDTISEAIPLSLITATASYYYQRHLFSVIGNQDAKEQVLLQMVREEMLLAENRLRITRMPRDPRLAGL